VGKRRSCNALAWHLVSPSVDGCLLVAGMVKEVHSRLDANFQRGILATPSADGMFIGCWSGEKGSIPLLQQRLFKPLSGETGQSVS
jgi:hypothetical protein